MEVRISQITSPYYRQEAVLREPFYAIFTSTPNWISSGYIHLSCHYYISVASILRVVESQRVSPPFDRPTNRPTNRPTSYSRGNFPYKKRLFPKGQWVLTFWTTSDRCFHHHGLDNCSDGNDANYHDFLQVHLIRGIGHQL